jgi:hypothetical protein
MKNVFRPTSDIEDHNKSYFSGLPLDFLAGQGVSLADLYPFMESKYEYIKRSNTVIHFFGYYKFWDPRENFYYCQEHTGFSPNTQRSDGTYSKYESFDDKIDGFYYYLSYIKFGIGWTTSDSAHEIRDGKITSEEGEALVKRYDHEFQKKYYQELLEFCSITDEEVREVIDSWRSDNSWYQENGEWNLRHAVWIENQ